MRTILPLLLFLLAQATAFGNPPDEEDILRPRIPTHGLFFVEADAGTSITWFDGNPIYRAFFPSEEEARLFRSGFGVEPFGSFSFGVHLSSRLRIRLRGDYDVRVAERSGNTIDTCFSYDDDGMRIGGLPIEVEKHFRLQITYVSVALLAEYSLSDLFMFFGPSWSTPIERVFTETNRITNPNSICAYFDNTADSTRQIRAVAEGTDNVANVFSLKLGAGYLIEMGEDFRLVPQIGVDYPFGQALNDDEEYDFRRDPNPGERGATTLLNRHMFFRALQASIGIRYSF